MKKKTHEEYVDEVQTSEEVIEQNETPDFNVFNDEKSMFS